MSMRGRANARDDAPLESYFKTLKIERFHQTRFETRAKARLTGVGWIDGYYNRQRLHSLAGYCTPVQAEELLLAA
jgi:transposase InsO family protein